jgi:hypothetical protein
MLSNDAPGNRDKAFHYLVEEYTGQAGPSAYPLRLMADAPGTQICVGKRTADDLNPRTSQFSLYRN